MVVWRPIMAGKVTLGEVTRGEATLDHLLRINALLDFEAACQHALMKKD
jgi:hypothetical protein